jgi:lipopolysaccharide biosynthesis glycosyltransferase
MPSHCVCLISDRRQLFPTLLAAAQARAQTPAELADVLLCAIEPDSRAAADFAAACAAEGVVFLPVRLEDVSGGSDGRFAATAGGAIGMYARLFLDRFLPHQYEQVLYLDGDIQVRQPLAPLLAASLAPGRFLAASDPMVFVLGEQSAMGERVSRYMNGLGLSAEQHSSYFNSGVLRLNRNGWDEIGREAHAFLLAHGEACQFHDQSALNAVSAGRHTLMSFRWNFPIFFRNCGLEREIAPSVYHFMSHPKPWHGNFPPWNQAAVNPYRALLQRHPGLAAYYPEFAAWKTGKYQLQQRLKQVIELASWRFSARRIRILASEQAHTLA